MRLYLQFLVLLLQGCLDLADHLVHNVVHMSSSLGCADAVDERHLLKLSITQACNDLPSLLLLFYYLWELSVFLTFKVEITIVDKVLDL